MATMQVPPAASAGATDSTSQAGSLNRTLGDPVLLGLFQGWATVKRPWHVRNAPPKRVSVSNLVMVYKHGDPCGRTGDGLRRNTTVRLACGDGTTPRLVDVAMDDACHVSMTLRTPVACSAKRARKLRKLAHGALESAAAHGAMRQAAERRLASDSDDVDVDGDDDSDSHGAGIAVPNTPPPAAGMTHYLSIPLRHARLQASVARLQAVAAADDQRLVGAFVATSSLHVTLGLVALPTATHVERAVQVGAAACAGCGYPPSIIGCHAFAACHSRSSTTHWRL